MAKPPFKIGSLGEIAIRCRDLDAMCYFYGETLGLERLPGNETREIVFFKICDGFAGHTNVLALFGEDDFEIAEPTRSSLHHLALSLSWEEQERAIAWYTSECIEFQSRDFDWIGWRGVFLTDPEGNIVELVSKRPNAEQDAP